MALIEQYKSGAVPPADVEFEDYSQAVRAATSDNTAAHLPKVRIKQLFKKNKVYSVQQVLLQTITTLASDVNMLKYSTH